MGFFSSLFGGSSDTLNSLIPKYGKIGDTQTGQGQGYEDKAGKFWGDIVSGDSSKVSQALAPEISAAKTRTQQDQKTNTEFGTRSGGTAASNAASTDKLHSDITNLIGSLTSSSVSNLANLGTKMVDTGLTSLNMEQQADAARMQNWRDSIFGGAITGAAGIALKGATGGVGGA